MRVPPRRHVVVKLVTAVVVFAAPVVGQARPASALPCVQVTNDYPFVFVEVCPPL